MAKARRGGKGSSKSVVAKPRAGEGKRWLIGVVVDGVSTHGRSILRGVLRHNVGRQWVIHKDLWRTPETLSSFPQADGAIIAGLQGAAIEAIRARCRHVVVCAGGADPALYPVVSLDDLAAGRMAAEHLLECRLQHFAFYGNTGRPSAATNRLAGFTHRLAQSGHAVVVSRVPWPTGTQWFTHAHRPELISWLRDLAKPVGVFAADDAAAHDLADTCLEAGLRVPEQVAILGVNNDELLCEGAFPTLSSIEADYSRVGQRPAELLDALLRGGQLSAADRVARLPPLRVVQRVSTSILAVNDPTLAEAMQYIREHACDPCTVSTMIRHLAVSRRSLERQFVAELGRTPHEEIVRVRIEWAKRLLLVKDIPVSDVATRCGFWGSQNLARPFRQLTGTTPAAFRRGALRTQ